ncbi:hypothetical protein V6N11_080207 [Hibiscus sabdariffa]|uniref:C3H1-type domain-containing protein n=1 Tax=Hibiscus sabdariffa TaxID=183260 RepID=A0ABR1Z6Y9_9ROSI
MDSYEATGTVFSRIQSLDPENASKIMGYLLIQDHGEKEMIRLAFGPEAHIHSLILKAKTHMRLSFSNPPTPSAPFSPSPFSSKPTPSSPPTTTWPSSISNSNLSYASVVNGSSAIANDNGFIDEYQFHDHLSFPEDLFSPRLDLAMPDSLVHRRSFSVPGLCFGAADDVNSGIGWKPCLYFARGFCKNGTSCRFLHGDCVDGGAALVGSPSKLNELEQYQELLRSKALHQQQQKLASNYVRSATDALMMGDELHKLGRCRPERNEFSASRQIYLTFPADSTFKEEDVSNYFR